MGTSCLLGIKKANGKVDFSIVNYDGYLTHVGETLIYKLSPHAGHGSSELEK